MKLGVLSKLFPRKTIEDTFDAIAEAGFKCVQLNPEMIGLEPVPKVFPEELADRVRWIAEERGIGIATVQATFNMSHPDPEVRQDGLLRLRGVAGACRTLGTSVIAICIGTRNRQNMWLAHPDNNTPAAWADMLSCVSQAARIAEQFAVTLALEPEVSNVVDSAQKARRLLDEIGSRHLKITMDPANLFHAGELPRMQHILEDAFALLGRDIVVAHAKDLSHDGEAGQEAAGCGKLDYNRYISLLGQYHFEGPLLLHGLREGQVPTSVLFLKEKLALQSPRGR
jgi:sugar phosphate isomerase/epimerase